MPCDQTALFPRSAGIQPPAMQDDAYGIAPRVDFAILPSYRRALASLAVVSLTITAPCRGRAALGSGSRARSLMSSFVKSRP